MPTKPRLKTAPASMVFPSHSDPIRVVPMHMPKEATAQARGVAPPAPAPQLTYRNGPLLAAAEVYTIFWGSAWNTAPQTALMGQLNKFFDFILTSALIDQLKEYSVPSYTIAAGKRTGTLVVTSPTVGHSVTDSAIQHMIQNQIASNPKVPKPNKNTLYFVYMPPGVKVIQGGSASCTSFCGYHNDIAGQVFYAAMPYPSCTGCTGGLAPFDALTSTSSHELCEAITDAIPGQGWYDDTHGEIGDICAWMTKKVGAYTVQLEWSNIQNKCV